jgi:hypothetical protein
MGVLDPRFPHQCVVDASVLIKTVLAEVDNKPSYTLKGIGSDLLQYMSGWYMRLGCGSPVTSSPWKRGAPSQSVEAGVLQSASQQIADAQICRPCLKILPIQRDALHLEHAQEIVPLALG